MSTSLKAIIGTIIMTFIFTIAVMGEDSNNRKSDKKQKVESVKEIIPLSGKDKEDWNNYKKRLTKHERLILFSSKAWLVWVKKLVEEEHVDIHYNNEEAMRVAIRNGCINVMEYLIENGVDVNCCEGSRLIEESFKNKDDGIDSETVFYYLRNKGADLHYNNDELLVKALTLFSKLKNKKDISRMDGILNLLLYRNYEGRNSIVIKEIDNNILEGALANDIYGTIEMYIDFSKD